MRAFIAVDLPPEIQMALGQAQALLREQLRSGAGHDESLRWASVEGIHLTLKFLGEISQEASHRVVSALRALQPFEPFPVEIRGYGFFPDRRRPQVLWAGIIAPPVLAELAGRIDGAMATLGYPPETRPFAPHLTLARLKGRRRQPVLESALTQFGERTLGQFEISELFLFESQLSFGAPAQYRKVARFPDRSEA